MGKATLTTEERDRRAVDDGFNYEDLPNGNSVLRKLDPFTLDGYGKILAELDE
jgi:hypothetical protein